MLPDIDHEVKCLRKWIKNMEICLPPLDLRAKYTKTEIEAKALELMVSVFIFSRVAPKITTVNVNRLYKKK